MKCRYDEKDCMSKEVNVRGAEERKHNARKRLFEPFIWCVQSHSIRSCSIRSLFRCILFLSGSTRNGVCWCCGVGYISIRNVLLCLCASFDRSTETVDNVVSRRAGYEKCGEREQERENGTMGGVQARRCDK